MTDEKKIDRAIEQVRRLIDDLSEPGKMSREEAFEFYDGLDDEIATMRDALKVVGDA